MSSKLNGRRLSAPGRRRNDACVLKLVRKDTSFSSGIPHSSSSKYPSRSPLREANLMVQPVLHRASGRAALKAMKEERSHPHNFRAPVRESRPGEHVKGYTCGECEKFAELLRSENVHKSVIEACSRHKFFCEPSSTPPNLWAPWEIDSYVSTVRADD